MLFIMAVVIKDPIISYKFYNVPQYEQKYIKEIVQKNIIGKADSYLKSIYANKPDAKVNIDYKIQQNKQNKYEASFRFSYDGKMYVYKNKTAFKYTADLVNHAFKHFVMSVWKEQKK